MRKRPSQKSNVTPQQCKAARALLDWTQEILASESGVSVAALRDFERGKRKMMPNNLKAVKTAFDAAGIEFISGGVKRR